MRFAKGHGTENDFVILPDPDGLIDLTAELVARLCDRRAGLGADGVLRAVQLAGGPGGLLGLPTAPGGESAVSGLVAAYGLDGLPAADSPGGIQAGPAWFMDYRNADGSLAEMCGNGIRVFARYLIELGLADGPEFSVATRAGTRLVRAEPDGAITVDMGPPRVLGTGRAVLAGRPLDGLRVSLGNPHLACVVDEPLDGFDLSGPPVLDAGQFPEGANLELVRLVGDGHIEMLVYERGSGPTRSCGTGAVAAAVAAALAPPAAGGSSGAPPADARPAAGRPAADDALVPAGTWTVDLPGGRLRVILDGRTSFLAGPAVIVAEGELGEAWLAGKTLTPGQSWPAA